MARKNMTEHELLSFIGKRIRRERVRRGLSQEAFAEKAGFHRTYIGTVERGAQSVTLQSYNKFARALGLNICELLSGLDDLHVGSGNGNQEDTCSLFEDKTDEFVFVDANTFAMEPKPVFIFDMQGKVVHVNPAFTKLMGYTAEVMSGRHITAIYAPECIQEVRLNLINILTGFLSVCRVPLMTENKIRIMAETKLLRGYWEYVQIIIGTVNIISLESA
ncbi:helix-turn-helix domain-containing protein [Pelodictyon luteolum]|nr:helix-turn-helix domain-containing protein [Pelodictyon luteolum]